MEPLANQRETLILLSHSLGCGAPQTLWEALPQLDDANEKLRGVIRYRGVDPINHALLPEILLSLGFWEPLLC